MPFNVFVGIIFVHNTVWDASDMGEWILLIDDDTSNLRMASHILSGAKMRVSCLKSGKDALQFLQKNKPDLILLDIYMPEMDGFKTLAAIKENAATADIPVVFLSADDDSNVAKRGLEAGGMDFIKKPFEPETLLHCISNTLDRVRILANRQYDKFGISIEKGLSLAKDDIDTYLDLIHLFLKDRKKQAAMQQLIAEQNMKDYAVLVHGLKGNARLLGADELADTAYEHEMKSKAEDFEYVNAHWDALLAVWNQTLDGFQAFYSGHRAEEDKYGLVNDNGEGRLKLSQSDLAEVLTLLDNFETAKAIKKLKTWIANPLEPDMHERIKNALTALEEEFDEDKAIALLKE